MLTLQEALLFKAVQEEQENIEAAQAATVLGSTGGALLGTAAGTVPHQMGRGLNALAGRKPAVLKPGFRMAGGLTGAILGGALGAGAAALMKQDAAGKALAKVQTRGDSMNDMERAEVAQLLSELYGEPSKFI